MLDEVTSSQRYTNAVSAQAGKFLDAERTPSAQVLKAMQADDRPFFRFAMHQAESLKEAFLARPLSTAEQQAFAQSTQASLQKQADIEAADDEDFTTFLKGYLAIPG